ncbi:MAG: extracellular solute-binding protein [Oscillatoriales cyanobacterium SM2_1_8]|nr:extracellular solute-binding protein [Oscillatoriales cyanobacterium SM2_1_8]
MKRRRFLGLGMGTLALGGCGMFVEPSRLKVWWVAGRLPKRITRRFAQTHPLEIKEFKTAPLLWQAWQDADAADRPHLVSLGDGWLDLAIAAELIQPIVAPPSLVALGQDLGQDLGHDLGHRQGLGYGWPWRWGTWVMVYRRDRVPSPPQTWLDLEQPAWRRKMVLPASAPLTIALALKLRGKSYGELSPDLAADLRSLTAQVLAWDNEAPLKILLHGDAHLAVVGSAEAAAAQRDYPQQLAIAEPRPPLLWAEVWMQAQSHPAIADWLDFCQGPTVQEFLQGRPGVQPLAVSPPPDSDWLKPLLPETARRYQAAWSALPNGRL